MKNRQIAHITDWNHAAQGIARVAGKVVFIQNALPGETVYWSPLQNKKSYTEGKIEALLNASAIRIQPACDYYQQCGGCNSQHIEINAQVALKQRAWLNQMHRIGKISPDLLLPPIYGQMWHYRERVRFAIDYKDGSIQLGFQSKRCHNIVDIDHCAIVPTPVSEALPKIKKILAQWPAYSVQAVSVNIGNEVIALSMHMSQINSVMRQQLNQLVDQLSMQGHLPWQWWWVRNKQVELQYPDATPVLAYTLPEYQIRIPFLPVDFTQVNQLTNALMVQRAMFYLQPQTGERIIDWFCGLGNFSLAMARLGAKVLGVEGVAAMVQRADNNAALNHLRDCCHFKHMNLFKINATQLRKLGLVDKWLLDPPRAGAQALITALNDLNDDELPKCIVYISCDPATLARDARQLVERGYFYQAGGIMNLFPHTAHVESLAIFKWQNN